MGKEVERIFMTNEFHPDAIVDDFDTNTDVIVQLKTGEKYIASFITYQNVERTRKENLESGDFIKGKYFWKKQMVLIEDCKKETIGEVVKHLLEEGDFDAVFKKITD